MGGYYVGVVFICRIKGSHAVKLSFPVINLCKFILLKTADLIMDIEFNCPPQKPAIFSTPIV